MSYTHVRNLFVTSLFGLLTACSSSNSSENSSISGTIVGPDGETPLVNASVYIPDTSGTPKSLKSATRSPGVISNGQLGVDCPLPDEPYLMGVCTASDGSFTLIGENFGDTLKAFKGVFSVNFDLNTNANGAQVLGNVEINAGSGDNHNIAVITGDYDSMENLLAKSGLGNVNESGHLILGTEQFDLFDGNGSLDETYPSFSELLDDRGDGQPRLDDYDIVFINCGAYEYEGVNGLDPTDAATRSALRSYVEAGGRLYATDLAYDFIEQTFPEFIDFVGSDSTPANQGEAHNDAEVGLSGIAVPNAEILDESLRSFLGNLSCEGEQPCLNDDGTIHIEGFLSGWSIMEGAHNNNPNTNFLVQGSTEMDIDEFEVKPLTVALTVDEGKVFYSSYHTEDMDSTELLPQERVLQYLVFE